MCILREISEEALHILITDGKTYTFVKKREFGFSFLFYFGQCREKSVAPLAFLPQSYHCIFDESLLHLRNISCEKMEFIEKERNNLLEFSPTTAEAENNCISAEQSVSLKIRLSHCTGIRITSPP